MEDKLNQLRRRFLERCRANLPALQAGNAMFGRPREERQQQDFLGLVHSLAGTAGIFGFPEISNAAIDLEAVLREDDGPIDVETAKALLDRLVVATCDALKTNQDVESP
jgi:HPt (histidine-containing phosphotransfer) domain-containing protein